MKLGLIAGTLGLTLSGGGGDTDITGVAPLETAGPDEISFISGGKAEKSAKESRAGALILPNGAEADRPSFITGNPKLIFARVAALLNPEKKPEPGIHPMAVVGASVNVGDGVFIGPFAVIGDGAILGPGVVIRAGVKIGERCRIGANTDIRENTAIYAETQIGARCLIHANTTIGADGFGFARDDKTGRYVKIPQLGRVVIEDDVEIGASCTVDRATMDITIIKSGAKLDDQVHIGHNVSIGRDVVIAGCSGVAGSTVIEDGVMIGGMAGVTDNVRVCSGAIIAAHTGVHGSITEPGVYSGPLAMKRMEYNRFLMSRQRLDKVEKRLKELEAKQGQKLKADGE
ncbi:MAG: UDP-3-O-(3-hydroxymyristoyl)glucosamine N-acyltransferase [Nitrospinae bacterium]|nr:UDP-3-O-(3-hydroxymyristoyl)glucosamine N-acyltransferase [Nitrospinota bacterium]